MRNKRHIFAAELTAALLLSAPGMETYAAAGVGIPMYQEAAWEKGLAAYEAKAAGDGRLSISGTYQEAAWKDGRVVYEAKTAGNCRLVTDSTAEVTWSPGWYVAEGSVTALNGVRTKIKITVK